MLIALITTAVFAKGDWKHKPLVRPEDQLTDEVTAEIIADEGVR